MHLKYIHRPDIGREMGRIIAHELSKRGFFREIDALVPVPLHWIRHWKRGYNQSLQLALGIHKVTRIPVWEHVVRRTRNNATQTSKSYTERMQNVENLFAARPLGKPCHLLLIDDVLTTGATLTSCAQSILAANPDVRFSILTLAKA